ncbi:MAG TPA: hypothetical protein VFD49_04930 [Candidatus Dormibacteraeota bacterium]|nr:hypothetical protein [Candidatus Dormibacteraeota bacterium]
MDGRRTSAAVVVTCALALAGSLSGSAVGARAAGPPRPPVCDVLDPTSCLLPFPDDFYTVPDRSTPTGRRVAFPVPSMPVNAAGVPIDPSAWNLNDGFSPGTPILVHVPGLDPARSHLAPITDIGASLDPDSGAVLLDEQTGQRWPYFAELDANDPDPAEQALIIHPARNLTEGHTYAVALRDLRTADGQPIPPPPAFAALLHAGGGDPAVEQRRPQIERVLGDLARAHVPRQGLYLAWDFTVASTANLTGRLLHMRDVAFSQLGDAAPAFAVSQVTDFSPDQNPLLQRLVVGTFQVPSFLDRPGGPPGSRLNLGPDGLPEQLAGNVQQAQFVCVIPRSASPQHPAHPSLYGHGLLGTPFEVEAHDVQVMAATYDFVFCATPEIGMAQEDIPNAVRTFQDFSNFPSIPDRLQQALLDELFLGRLLTHPRGFAGSPAFQSPDGRPLIDRHDPLAYDGNSQGGILGGALMAVAQDIPRGVLGVPGMDYAILIDRSVDAVPFLQIMDQAYPDPLIRQIIFGLLQMLWDRGEADGYAENMTGHPLPGTPSHQVLLQVAFGDHQVANVATDIEARTIGAFIHQPALRPGRSPDLLPYWGIPAIPSYPFHGSAMFVWDSGTPPAPLTNTPPLGPQYGQDPHGMPRNQPAAQLQKAVFLDTGAVIDVCGGKPCLGVNP